MTPTHSSAPAAGRTPGRTSGRMSAGHARWPARCGAAAVLVALPAAVAALLVAPAEAIQGQPQRLMYVHVPAAWVAFMAFGAVSVASTAGLLVRSRRWPAVALASAELAVAMTALTLVEGSVWGHSAWGVWWAWDPRLVSTALLFLVGVAYLALRALPGDRDRTERRANVAGLVFAALVPLAHVSVLWWRTLHQPPTLLRPDLSPPIAPLMLVALLLSLAAFTLAGAWYVGSRYRQLVGEATGSASEPMATGPELPAARTVSRTVSS